MANKILTTPPTNRHKTKTSLFNFPLSTATRDRLEELASVWDVSLAAAIRRSINNAYKTAVTDNSTVAHEVVNQDRMTTLVSLLNISNELKTTKNNTADILATMPLINEVIAKIEQLNEVVTASLQKSLPADDRHDRNKTK
jgi:hypothetical protein